MALAASATPSEPPQPRPAWMPLALLVDEVVVAPTG